MAELNHKVTKFPGMYDKDMNTDLYLLFEKTISKAQYDCIKENLNVVFPDGQILDKGDGTYIMRADQEDVGAVEESVKATLAERGVEYPAS